jgi:hypothetical protein
MSQQYLVRHDTQAWIVQVWIAFAVSVLLCAIGLWNLPALGTGRAFLTIGFLFCISSALSLAKTIRDNRDERVDTDMWIMQVWIAFGVAVTSTLWGLLSIDLDFWRKAYFFASALFLISSTFVLAKTIRDNHEAAVLESLPTPTSEPTQ